MPFNSENIATGTGRTVKLTHRCVSNATVRGMPLLSSALDRPPMPLVVVCGYPCSGKSELTSQLKDHLEQSWNCKTHIVSDDYEKLPRNECYASSSQEKEARGTLKAAVERLLNTKDVVVLDSLNYIKGYRYELYCIVRQLRTVHCVVQCATTAEQCAAWNEARRGEKYSKETLTALVQRFEPPDSRNRWDSPLFVWAPDQPLPLEEVARAVLTQAPKPPKQSTQSQPLSSVDFMQELDQGTKTIVSHLMEHQRAVAPPCQVRVPGTSELVSLHRSVTLAELTRLRRQFVSYTKLHPMQNPKEIPTLFVQYLNKTLM